jgi:uncharacterized OB-fold protein
MTKFVWSCHDCGTVLAMWKMKCPNCHKTALSWLHLVACAAVVLPTLFLVLKLI